MPARRSRPGTSRSGLSACSASGTGVAVEELRLYFCRRACCKGLFDVAQRLFGVTIRERTDVPKWHADVRYFEIVGANGRPTGSFYLDPTRASRSAAAPGWT